MARRIDPLELSHEDYMDALDHEDDTDESHLFDNTNYDPLDDGILKDDDDSYDIDFPKDEDDSMG